MGRAKKRTLFLLVLTLYVTATQANEVIRVPSIENQLDRYAQSLLLESLETQRKHIVPQETKGTNIEPRMIVAMEHNELDVAWIAAGKYNSKNAIAIPVPIYTTQLSDYAIVTHQSASPSVTDIKQLASLKIGVLRFDPAISQFKNNNIDVYQARFISQLMTMLKTGRVDIITLPRLMLEADLARQTEGLKVLPISIHIPSEYHFYVNAKKPNIAEKLTAGLDEHRTSGRLIALLASSFSSTNYDTQRSHTDLVTIHISSGRMEQKGITKLANTDTSTLGSRTE